MPGELLNPVAERRKGEGKARRIDGLPLVAVGGERARHVRDPLAGEGGLDRFAGEPRDGLPLLPEVRTRQGVWGDVAAAVPRGPGRPGGPGTLRARPPGAMEGGKAEGRAQGA